VGNNGARHAVLWQENGEDVIDLGVRPGSSNTTALAINDFGEVVGTSWDIGHAFLWTRDRGMQDLNDLPPNSGWVINSASSINLEGMICGYGALNGATHGFVLAPTRADLP